MSHLKARWRRRGAVGVGLPLFATSCLLAAAGAGAGGGIYFTERGVASVVPVSMDRAAAATKQTFDELKVRQTKASSEQQTSGERRELDGAVRDRDVSVTLTVDSTKTATRVYVVAKTSAVTWDKDLARTILERIVAYSR